MSASFETLYRRQTDPWGFATRQYERDRYRTILDALLRPCYANAYEPGCSIGELTVQLAPRCSHLTALDIAPSAVERARRRCAQQPHVEIHCEDVITHPRPGPFDLIILSELGYYFEPEELGSLALVLSDALDPGGELVAAHWLGRSEDHVLHGDAVHATLYSHLPLRWIKGARYGGFRIDSWRRA
jgi:cyclopropane fatty-acyl-phospholipid synthase-like methyltransferase